MLPLPKNANFKRGKILWEIGLDIAADPATPYGGNRDMQVVIGSGAGESFTPWLRLATGSAVMAHAVARGEITAAFVNPSAMLTQAFRGQGIFRKPLDLRVLASYPSIDRFVIAVKRSLGFGSLHDVRKARYPLRVSLREDPTHSTLPLIDQILAIHGMTLGDLEGWGGGLHLVGPPGDGRRLAALADGSIDAVFDEGISVWLAEALAADFVLLDLDDDAFDRLGRLGWRRVPVAHGRFAHFPAGHDGIDFSGWPLYASAALPDATAYRICQGLAARHDAMTWEVGTHEGLAQIGAESDATPLDVPFHPGAARFWKERLGS